nr:LEAF RUST 10 DISEASE-RESISTANCE LOCUS RECEPTOR-LIKE PROTEIN KINASE-like 2.1 [Arachis hypogaea]
MASLLVMLLPHLMILLIMIQIPPYLSSNDDNYTSCADTRYDCGKINNIGFPFWGGNRPKQCGHPLLQLNCDPDHDSTTYITIKNMTYRVLEAYSENQTMKIARVDYFEGLCPSKPVNTSLDFELFDYGPGNKNLTLFYHCSLNNGLPNSIPGFLNCFSNRTSNEYFYARPEALGAPPSSVVCTTSVFIPLLLQLDVEVELTWNNIEGAIQNGFLVKWIGSVTECFKCMNSGGACGYDWNSKQATCYCKDESNYSNLGDGLIKTCDSSATSPPHQDDHVLPNSGMLYT